MCASPAKKGAKWSAGIPRARASTGSIRSPSAWRAAKVADHRRAHLLVPLGPLVAAAQRRPRPHVRMVGAPVVADEEALVVRTRPSRRPGAPGPPPPRAPRET